MLEMMWDDLFCNGGCPFKMKLEHPQLQIRGKMKRQGLQSHHSQPMVSSVLAFSSLLLSYGRVELGGVVVILSKLIEAQMLGQNGQKPAYIIKEQHSSINQE